MNDYFQPAGDLDNISPNQDSIGVDSSIKQNNDTNVKNPTYFETAGDLSDVSLYQTSTNATSSVKQKNDTNINSQTYFKPAGDLSDGLSYQSSVNNNISAEKVNDYLLTVVSGKKFGSECDLGTLCSEGSIIVSLEKLQKMIDEGTYNIVSAQYFNPEMVSIVYEQYSKEYIRRF